MLQALLINLRQWRNMPSQQTMYSTINYTQSISWGSRQSELSVPPASWGCNYFCLHEAVLSALREIRAKKRSHVAVFPPSVCVCVWVDSYLALNGELNLSSKVTSGHNLSTSVSKFDCSMQEQSTVSLITLILFLFSTSSLVTLCWIFA